MRKIAILNFKGGTGETTTAVNLSHALALGIKAASFPANSKKNVGTHSYRHFLRDRWII